MKRAEGSFPDTSSLLLSISCREMRSDLDLDKVDEAARRRNDDFCACPQIAKLFHLIGTAVDGHHLIDGL